MVRKCVDIWIRFMIKIWHNYYYQKGGEEYGDRITA